MRDNKGRFVKGESGNPNGRPKFSIVSIIREKLQSIPKGEKRTIAEKLIDEYIEKADGPAIRDMIDRIDGKPRQYIEMNNEKDAEWVEIFRDIKNEAIRETKNITQKISTKSSQNINS